MKILTFIRLYLIKPFSFEQNLFQNYSICIIANNRNQFQSHTRKQFSFLGTECSVTMDGQGPTPVYHNAVETSRYVSSNNQVQRLSHSTCKPGFASFMSIRWNLQPTYDSCWWHVSPHLNQPTNNHYGTMDRTRTRTYYIIYLCLDSRFSFLNRS